MTAEVTLVAIVLLVSAVLQTSTGFGYGLLSAPILAATLGPAEAVSTIIATGVVVDALVLIAGGRRPQPHRRDVLELGAWSVPGLVLGAVLLTALPATALQFLVAAAVLLAVWHRARTRPTTGRTPRRRQLWLAALAGLTSGALSTATTLGGPPTVMYLTREPRPPQQTRDTLVALSLLRLPISVAALWYSGAWIPPTALPLLWAAVVLGYLSGRWIFARLDVTRYQRAVLLTLLAAGLTAIITGLLRA
ncbi:sulfite exporter TauE/SafE family protein [Catenuloplanes sp. NPDC051500]|uniref:sulfite exporter TauE/SafE family protein n=1 Tax=Catenuloplanes sp. NPDC051500 TaxID=3363959 RepID=UPI003787FF19